MSTATLSRNNQISLPEELIKILHLQPGQEFELLSMGSTIQLIPKLSTKALQSAIADGISSGQNRSTDEVFDRLEAKYRKLTTE